MYYIYISTSRFIIISLYYIYYAYHMDANKYCINSTLGDEQFYYYENP
jgi:hypothetical protein